jgi:endonuclease-3
VQRARKAGPDERTREKAARIARLLFELYPDPPIPLAHRDPFTLLVAVVLSAQTTDARVNLVTPALFARARTARELARLAPEEILGLIRSCGLAPSKARNLAALARLLVERHCGQVPRTFAELEALPGVGHKTASVVLAQAFGIPAFPVDTHIHRLAARWGLSDGSSVERTERDLKRLFPEDTWIGLHLRLILFGREHCPALRHDLSACPICSWAAPQRSVARGAATHATSTGTRQRQAEHGPSGAARRAVDEHVQPPSARRAEAQRSQRALARNAPAEPSPSAGARARRAPRSGGRSSRS